MDCSQASLSFCLPECAQTHAHWVGDAIQTLLALSLALSLSQHQGFFPSKLALRIRWPKYWSFSFSFSISPSNEYSGLISFGMDWFDLLAVVFLYTKNKHSETEIKGAIAFTTAPERVKCLGINLSKEVKGLSSENDKNLTKETENSTNRWKDTPCSLEELIWLKYPHYPRQSTDSVQIPLKILVAFT